MLISNDYILQHDVYDLDKKRIAQTGDIISSRFIHDLLRKRATFTEPKSYADYPDILETLCDLCQQPPYNKIFDSPEICQNVMKQLSRAKIYPIVLHALEHFKQFDFYTYRHSLVVAALSTRMALDFQSYYGYSLQAASVVPSHDIGKINIPVNTLQKKDFLSTNEIRLMRDHTTAGFLLLSYYIGDEDPASCQIAHEHHELINGKGYPRGIMQNNDLVQLITVCDMFDALVSPRPYRSEQYTVRAALELISLAAEKSKVNWNCVKLLIAYNRANKPSFDKVIVSKERRGKEPIDNKYSLGTSAFPSASS